MRRTKAVETSIQAVAAPSIPSAKATPENPLAANTPRVIRAFMATPLGARVAPDVHDVNSMVDIWQILRVRKWQLTRYSVLYVKR
ncbi:hypothetical protein FJNA_14260 [Thermus sp. FJN-A]